MSTLHWAMVLGLSHLVVGAACYLIGLFEGGRTALNELSRTLKRKGDGWGGCD